MIREMKVSVGWTEKPVSTTIPGEPCWHQIDCERISVHRRKRVDFFATQNKNVSNQKDCQY